MERVIEKVESFWNCVDTIKDNKSSKIKLTAVLLILTIPVYLFMVKFSMSALVCIIFQAINILFILNLIGSILLFALLVLMILVFLRLYNLLD